MQVLHVVSLLAKTVEGSSLSEPKRKSVACSFSAPSSKGLDKGWKRSEKCSAVLRGDSGGRGLSPLKQHKRRRAIGHSDVDDIVLIEQVARSDGVEDIFVKMKRYLKVPLCLRPRGVHKKYLSSIQWIFQLWSSVVSQCPPAGTQESTKIQSQGRKVPILW